MNYVQFTRLVNTCGVNFEKYRDLKNFVQILQSKQQNKECFFLENQTDFRKSIILNVKLSQREK